MITCAQVVTVNTTIPKHAECVYLEVNTTIPKQAQCVYLAGMTQHESAKVINTWVKGEQRNKQFSSVLVNNDN